MSIATNGSEYPVTIATAVQRSTGSISHILSSNHTQFSAWRKAPTAHVQVNQWRAFHRKPGNDNGTDPALAVFFRQIDHELQFRAGDLSRAFPAAGDAFRRMTQRGGSKKDCGE